MNEYPAIADIARAADAIGHAVVETPVFRWDTPEIKEVVDAGTEAHLKLELFQRTGTFKARGAIVNALTPSSVTRWYGCSTA